MERHEFRLVCVLVLLGCLLLSRDEAIALDATGDSSYYPLRIGNQWTLVSSGGRSITEKILDTIRVNGDLYFQFDTVQSQTNVLYRLVGQKVYRLLDSGAVLWYDFSADSGATWTIPQAQLEVTVTSTRDTVRVPAGFFVGCYRLYFFLGADAAWTEWFARGVGIVKRELITIAGATGWTLSHLIVTEVDHLPRSEQRADFALEQNYPNPFNGISNFRFRLPAITDRDRQAGISDFALVSLKIYDLLGREVNTLVNELLQAGTYQIRWNGKDAGGKDAASGLYLYSLQAGPFSTTRKMLLVR